MRQGRQAVETARQSRQRANSSGGGRTWRSWRLAEARGWCQERCFAVFLVVRWSPVAPSSSQRQHSPIQLHSKPSTPAVSSLAATAPCPILGLLWCYLLNLFYFVPIICAFRFARHEHGAAGLLCWSWLCYFPLAVFWCLVFFFEAPCCSARLAGAARGELTDEERRVESRSCPVEDQYEKYVISNGWVVLVFFFFFSWVALATHTDNNTPTQQRRLSFFPFPHTRPKRASVHLMCSFPSFSPNSVMQPRIFWARNTGRDNSTATVI